MKVSVNFNSSNIDDIERLRGELINLLHKIDIDLGIAAEATEDPCCNEECCGKCCCEEATDEIEFDEEFIDDASEGRVTEFLNLKLGDKISFDNKFVTDFIGYGFFKTHDDVDKFVLAFNEVSEREAEKTARDAIVSKLVNAGITETFAKHAVEHVDIDITKIPSKYIEGDFIKLLEYLGIKEDFVEKQKREDEEKINKYLFNEIGKLSKVSKCAANAAVYYFTEFKPSSIEEIDEKIANVKKQFKFTEPVCADTSNESDDTKETEDSYVKTDIEERKGYSKRASDHFKKMASDKKSNKTK